MLIICARAKKKPSRMPIFAMLRNKGHWPKSWFFLDLLFFYYPHLSIFPCKQRHRVIVLHNTTTSVLLYVPLFPNNDIAVPLIPNNTTEFRFTGRQKTNLKASTKTRTFSTQKPCYQTISYPYSTPVSYTHLTLPTTAIV